MSRRTFVKLAGASPAAVAIGGELAEPQISAAHGPLDVPARRPSSSSRPRCKVDVRATRYDDMTHEFFSMSGVIDKSKQAVAEAAARLKTSFGT